MLTPRQERILCSVVDTHIQTGQPVAARAIAADPSLDCGPSTVRNEFSLLEEQGLLTHPHTSAGRVPTDAGRRYVVDLMLASGKGLEPARRLGVSLVRSEVEDAIRITTEGLALQAQVVAVVIITSTGGVSKMIATFDRPVDAGLVHWAGEYLNERLV